jgi:hypothetical protein
MSDAVTREQVLDELHYLATVEHALLVDYLIIHCALGADAIEDPGPATTAAGDAFNMAMDEMRHIKSVNQALRAGGRPPSVDRAAHIVPAPRSGTQPASKPPIPVGSFTPDQLRTFAKRETAVAAEVDRRWERVGAVLTTLGRDAEDIGNALGAIPQHASSVAALVGPLATLPPSAYLRATRVLPADEFERRSLALSDRYYQTIVATLPAFFAHDELSGLLGNAVSIMFSLQSINRELVRRGVLPSFTLAPTT